MCKLLFSCLFMDFEASQSLHIMSSFSLLCSLFFEDSVTFVLCRLQKHHGQGGAYLKVKILLGEAWQFVWWVGSVYMYALKDIDSDCDHEQPSSHQLSVAYQPPSLGVVLGWGRGSGGPPPGKFFHLRWLNPRNFDSQAARYETKPKVRLPSNTVRSINNSSRIHTGRW